MCRCWRVSQSQNLFESCLVGSMYLDFYFWTSDLRHFALFHVDILANSPQSEHAALGVTPQAACVQPCDGLTLIPLRKAALSKKTELTALPQQLNAACLTTSFRLPLLYSLFVSLSFILPPHFSVYSTSSIWGLWCKLCLKRLSSFLHRHTNTY